MDEIIIPCKKAYAFHQSGWRMTPRELRYTLDCIYKVCKTQVQ